MKKKIAYVVLGIFIVCILMFVMISMKIRNELKELKYQEIKLEEVEDGIYYGFAEVMVVKVELKVIIEQHKIVSIEILKHENGLGSSAEDMLDEIVSRNSLNVDSISGATISSEVIKGAIYNAFNQEEN